jgi:hypothetical protein
VTNHGRYCWELDALDPNALRDCFEQAIIGLIEPVAWKRCARVTWYVAAQWVSSADC